MRHVVLTVDYEIFGNGTGDVRKHIVDPTEQMIRSCDRHGAPLTVFFEVEEYLHFVKHRAALTKLLGYDPAALIRHQIASLVPAGHDVQLHLHPEWHGAEFEKGRWILHDKQSSVDSLFESEADTIRYIRERKEVIEEMVGGRGNHSVRVYRAGAFCAQPGAKLLAALKVNQFCIDSSVVHGLHRTNENETLDYRNAPGKARWKVSADVSVEDPSGVIWEIPIASIPGRRLNQVTFGRLKAKFSRNVPKAQQKQMVRDLGVSANPLNLAKFLWQKIPLKLDFHNVQPRKLVRWIKTMPPPPPGDPLDVVVLIGHTKEHVDPQGFEEFVRLVSAEPNLKVVSFNEIAGLLCEKKSRAIPIHRAEAPVP